MAERTNHNPAQAPADSQAPAHNPAKNPPPAQNHDQAPDRNHDHDQAQDQAQDPARVGVYICYCGGNISDHVDVEAVRARMAAQPGVAVARTNMFMCSDPGQELIMEDLRAGRINRVVVASCSPSLHEGTFRSAIARAGGNPYQYEHANIREQVSWVHHGQAATDKATRLISAAAGKAGLLDALSPLRVEALRRAVVIGGGVAGLRAALDMADSGIQVLLVERTAWLGGAVARLGRLAPVGEDASGLLRGLAGQVLAHPGVTVHARAVVSGFGGYLGNFSLTLSRTPDPDVNADVNADANANADAVADAAPLSKMPSKTPSKMPSKMTVGGFVRGLGVLAPTQPDAASQDQGPLTVRTGVIVLATGHRSYTPKRGEYGYAENPEVLTLPRLIQHLADTEAETGPLLVLNGRAIRRLAIIHCVGSRQIPGIHQEDESGCLNEHCSRVCCAASINAANQVRERHPQTSVYELYRDIRTYGRGQEEMYAKAAANRVVFLRYSADDAPEVRRCPAGQGFPLEVAVRDGLTLGQELRVPVDLVALATGMVPGPVAELVDMLKLPVGADRFLQEVHPKLRPVELPLPGVFLAGTCQAPMDIGEVCSAASAAAVKAVALLSKGHVELDPFVAEVDEQACTGCGACVAACLNKGALGLETLELDGAMVSRARVTPALCLGCGACVAVCPEYAIDINGWTLAQYEAMVDRIVCRLEGVA